MSPSTLAFDSRTRYLQIAFNDDLQTACGLVRQLPRNSRILVEAGTPFIKREGLAGIKRLRRLWTETLVADVKVTDGAVAEVDMVKDAGADAATVIGSSPPETLDFFIHRCRELGLIAMIDMLGVSDPLRILRKLKGPPPHVVVLHRGRDEENTRGKIIEYRHIARIRSKFNVAISAAGGVDLHEARSAIFNGVNIVVVNVVPPASPWQGISSDQDISVIAQQFLDTIR
jgi:bifunctional enzyme Fae/Hps